MTNKLAGFWVRLIARIIDIVIVGAIATGIAFALMNQTTITLHDNSVPVVTKNVQTWMFIAPWAFYVWGFSFMVLLFISGIGIPLLTKGRSIGQLIFRIKVVSKDGNLVKGIFKREVYFTWSWMFTTLLVIAFINHTLIDEFARTNKFGVYFSDWENARIGIVTGIGSITVFIQMVVAISGLVRSDKRGLHDVYGQTLTVWENKYINKPKEANKEIERIKPEAVHNVSVDWIK